MTICTDCGDKNCTPESSDYFTCSECGDERGCGVCFTCIENAEIQADWDYYAGE